MKTFQDINAGDFLFCCVSFLMCQDNVKHQALLVTGCVLFCRSRFERDLTSKTQPSPGVVFGFFFALTFFFSQEQLVGVGVRVQPEFTLC